MKYKYNMRITNKLREITAGMNQEEIDFRYIENFNICPFCGKEFKTYRGEVVDTIGGISMHMPYTVDENKKKYVVYFICKSCSGNRYRSKEAMNKMEDKLEEQLNSITG